MNALPARSGEKELAGVLDLDGYTKQEGAVELTEDVNLFKNVIIDGGTIDAVNIGYGSGNDATSHAWFGSLIVGMKNTDSYMLPAKDGQAGEVIIANGEGAATWQKIGASNLDDTVVKSTDTRLTDPRKWNGFFSTDADKTNALYSLGIAGFRSFPCFEFLQNIF